MRRCSGLRFPPFNLRITSLRSAPHADDLSGVGGGEALVARHGKVCGSFLGRRPDFYSVLFCIFRLRIPNSSESSDLRELAEGQRFLRFGYE